MEGQTRPVEANPIRSEFLAVPKFTHAASQNDPRLAQPHPTLPKNRPEIKCGFAPLSTRHNHDRVYSDCCQTDPRGPIAPRRPQKRPRRVTRPAASIAALLFAVLATNIVVSLP